MKRYDYKTVNPFERIFLSKHVHNVKEEEHEHNFIECSYIFSGEGYQTINGVKNYVHAGDFLIMECKSIHSFTPIGSMGVVNCIFMPSFIDENLPENASFLDFSPFPSDCTSYPPILNLYGETLAKVDNLLDTMLQEFNLKSYGYVQALRNQLGLLFVYLFRFMMPEDIQAKQAHQKITPELISYIKMNYNKKISLKDLAHDCFYNPVYFSELFKKTMGVNLSDFINQIRINNAKKYLSETDFSIDKISNIVGFNNRTQFYKIFRKKTDMSPNEYRIKNKK